MLVKPDNWVWADNLRQLEALSESWVQTMDYREPWTLLTAKCGGSVE